MARFRAKAAWAVGALGLSALAACSAPGEGGSTLGNMVLFAGPTVPPPVSAAVEDVYCPPVTITEGGSAIQAYSGGRVGESGALRSQVAINQLARECVGQADGTTVVKVGVEGRALLGTGGGAGRFDVPVHVLVKRGSTVIASRSRRVSVAIPAGEAGANFAVVEDGIVVPAADSNSFEIEVGLGSRPVQGRRRG